MILKQAKIGTKCQMLFLNAINPECLVGFYPFQTLFFPVFRSSGCKVADFFHLIFPITAALLLARHHFADRFRICQERTWLCIAASPVCPPPAMAGCPHRANAFRWRAE